MAVEDHGAGTQYVRCRIRPHCSTGGLVLSLGLALLAVAAGLNKAWPVCCLLGTAALISAYKTFRDTGGASAAILKAIRAQGKKNVESEVQKETEEQRECSQA
jgi:hypothetical protein